MALYTWSQCEETSSNAGRGQSGCLEPSDHFLDFLHCLCAVRALDVATTQGYVRKIESETVTLAIGEALAGTN